MLQCQLEEASTQKSAKVHIGSVFVTRDLDLWLFDSKLNGFSGLILQHLFVKLGNSSYICFEISCGEKQTDTRTNGGKNGTDATAVGVVMTLDMTAAAARNGRTDINCNTDTNK